MNDSAAMSMSHLVLAAAALTWLMIMTASMLHTRGDLRLGLSNRDAMPAPSPACERAGRAAKNMLENLVLFVAIAVAVGGQNPARAELGGLVFLVARAAYWPIYLAGITGLRTAAWAVSVAGLVIMATAAL